MWESARCTGRCRPFFSKVDVMPEETAPQVQETVEQDIITQETEETVAIKPKAEPKKKEEVKKPEKTEAEKAEEPANWQRQKPNGNVRKPRKLPVNG